MSLSSLLIDGCTIQNRTADTSGKTDVETFTAQSTVTPCRVIKVPNRRKTSPDNAEKVQYGTFVFLNVLLPKTANIAIHDRIAYQNRVYDVLEVIEAKDGKGVHHLVALCDVRA